MRLASRTLISQVMALARYELGKTGFQKRSGEIYTFEVQKGVLGWIGLNRAVARGDGVLEINPIIGVRHQEIEKMLAAFLDAKYHPYIPPTVGVHLGYLMPGITYIPWLFSEDADNQAAIREMASAINTYGRPFVESNASLDSLCKTLIEFRLGIPHQRAYRIPIVFFALGKIDNANTFLADEIAKLGDRADLAAKRYRMFAARLSEKLRT